MKNDNYYSLDRFSNSALTNFKKSPRHYLHAKNNPDEPTEAMLFGQAFHCYVLEGEAPFDQGFAVLPEDAPKRPTKAQVNAKKPATATIMAIEWWNNWNDEHQYRTVISQDDMDRIKRMQDALYSHKFARELLDEITETEKAILWKDEITGVEMKGKMDGYCTKFKLDLKTCQDASPDEFQRDAFNRALHRQAALYTDGAKLSGLKCEDDFYFIAIEKEEPHGVSVMKCTPEFIKHGRMVYGTLLEDVRYWIEMGSPNVGYEWRSPVGYYNLNLPAWVK